MGLPLRITLVKSFSYRGAEEEWSNTYGLSGGALYNYAKMVELAQFMIAFERNCYVPEHHVVRAYIYQPGSIVADRAIDVEAEVPGPWAGILSVPASACGWAGDQAGWIRGKIGVSSKGRPVYVRKYYHGGISLLSDPDQVHGLWTAGVGNMISALTTTGLPDLRNWVGPDGEPVTLVSSSESVTTRTLKRRGRRPTP